MDISSAELELVKYFNCEYFYSITHDYLSLYNHMIQKSFLDNDSSCYSVALRKAFQHLSRGNYRMNEEFEHIILNELLNEHRKVSKTSKRILT